MTPPLRWLAALGSPGGPGGLSILIFHRVLPRPDPLFPDEVDAARFETILDWVRGVFQPLPLDVAVQRLARGDLPPRALAITFDDGYADNHDIALPLLQRAGLSATFFIASGFLNGGRMWNDTVIEAVRATGLDVLDLDDAGLGVHDLRTAASRRQAIDRLLPAIKYLEPTQRLEAVETVARHCGARLPDDLMMTSDQLRRLRQAGMPIGGHTVHHPILARLTDDEARNEIASGKAQLEALLDERISLFAYPNGKPDKDYLARHATMVREAGFEAAVSTAPGVSRSSSDPFQLPRFTPWDRTPLRFGLRMIGNMRTAPRLAV